MSTVVKIKVLFFLKDFFLYFQTKTNWFVYNKPTKTFKTSFLNSQLYTINIFWNIFSGILMYRMFRNERKRKLKLLHAGIMIAVFLSAVIALKAVFDSHNLNPCKHPSTEGDICALPNLYSLHSWLGLLTVILFLFQVIYIYLLTYI